MSEGSKQKSTTGSRDLKIVVLIVTAFIILVSFVVALGSRGDEPAQSQSSAQHTEASSASEEPEEPKTWQEAISFSGSADKRSPVFELQGSETRMRYTVNGGDYAAVSIYVMKDGESLEEDGGSAEVSAAKEGDETRLIKPAGKYYLDVSAVNNPDWTVIVEELR